MSARVSLRPRDFGVAACALRLAVAEAVRSDFVQCFRGVAPALGRPSTDASLREGGLPSIVGAPLDADAPRRRSPGTSTFVRVYSDALSPFCVPPTSADAVSSAWRFRLRRSRCPRRPPPPDCAPRA